MGVVNVSFTRTLLLHTEETDHVLAPMLYIVDSIQWAALSRECQKSISMGSRSAAVVSYACSLPNTPH